MKNENIEKIRFEAGYTTDKDPVLIFV